MYKPLGLGYKVINYEKIDIDSPENQQILNDLLSSAKTIRGEIISNTLDIEYCLENLIAFFFFATDKNKRELFKEVILRTRTFTFKDKMDTLKMLIVSDSAKFHLTNDKRRMIFSNITKVMEWRNIFAHELIIVDFKDKTAYLLHKEDKYIFSSELLKNFQTYLFSLSQSFMTLHINLAIEINKELNREPEINRNQN